MTKRHTEEIAAMYLDDMGYDTQEFYKQYSGRMERYLLQSEEGHQIPVITIRQGESDDQDTIVLVHWHETNHKTMLPIAEFYLEEGYNVVLYDQRAHGDNDATTVTFGYREMDDLRDVIEDLTRRMDGDHTIGVMGQSMGAATVGNYLGTKHAKTHVDFAIMESGYSGMRDELAWSIQGVCKIKWLTDYALWLGTLANKLTYGFFYEDVDIEASMGRNDIPTLILHSTDDSVCPYTMGESLYEAVPHDRKQMVTFEGIAHVEAFFKAEGYEEAIKEFLANNIE